MNAIPLIELTGTPGERGFQHGQILRDAIGVLYDEWLRNARSSPNALRENELLGSTLALLPASRAYAVDLVDEVDGIAQGAGMPFERLFLLNCYMEVGIAGRQAGVARGCTGFAATGRATRTGTTYIGQGWDMAARYIPYIFRIAPAGGEPEILMLGHPGIPFGTGLSSNGLSLVWEAVRPTDTRIGVPTNFIIRKALQQQNLGEFVGAVTNCRRADGLDFLVGAPFAVVDIEATATRAEVIYSSTILSHANHYEAPRNLPYETQTPNNIPDTLIRTARMRQLLEEHFGRIDLATCQEIMRDHANWPGSICRHYIAGRTNSWQTQAAVILVPAEGKMYASNGRPCEGPFAEYTLTSTVQRERPAVELARSY